MTVVALVTDADRNAITVGNTRAVFVNHDGELVWRAAAGARRRQVHAEKRRFRSSVVQES